MSSGAHARALVALVRASAGAAPEARERAALEVVDAVACMRLGADHPLVLAASEASTWHEPGRCAAFAAENLGLEQAVRLDALACHVDELDGIEPVAAVAPGALVIAPALHVAIRTGASGAALIDAVLAGYDVLSALGRALGGSAAYARGWWPTSTLGAVGAAAAVGVLLELDDERLAAALGLASAGVGGLLSDDDLDAGHYLSAAEASVTGLRAAHLAAGGLRASSTYLSGPGARALGGALAAEPPVLAPGTGVLSTTAKPFPCARPLQAVAAALIDARVPLERAMSLTVELPAPLLRFVSTDVEVPDATRAAASLAHVVAAVRAGRAADARFFRAASLAGQAPLPRLNLRERDDAPPGSWAARVRVALDDGAESVLDAEPPTLEAPQVRAKAVRTLGDAGADDDAASAVVEALLSLDDVDRVDGLRVHERLRSPRAH